jgi:Ca-activated chloride channel family protein
MRVRTRIIGLVFFVFVCGEAVELVAGLQQTPASPKITILSPGDESYVTGPVLLRVGIEPPSAASRVQKVSFFADGRLVCQLPSLPYECAWDAGEGIKEHQIRASASLKDGTLLTANVRTKSVAFDERVDVELVQVTASVTDGGRRYIRGLTQEAFRVYEDDVPQTITYFGSQSTPLEVVIAIDQSGSMSEAMPSAKVAVKKFLSALRETDQVSLFSFNDNVYELARRETNLAARMRAIDRLRPWGGTALYDVILKSLQTLGRKQGRRALVVFTDGEDQSSHSSLEGVTKTVEASDATIYVIGQGRGTKTASLIEIQERLAKVSGGRAFQTNDPIELDTAFSEIVDELSNQYLLAYPPKNTRKDNTWRSIRVDVKGGHAVRARDGYRAASR